VSGCIESYEDMDYFSFVGNVGDVVTAQVDVESIESNLEGYYIELWNGTNELVYENYDQTPGTNIAITHEIQQSGIYYIKLYTTLVAGEYELTLLEFVTDEDSITIMHPNGGEEFSAGSQIDIQWTTNGSVPMIDLSYSADNGLTWTAIDVELENDNAYSWDVPLDFPVGSEYLIKVFDNIDGSLDKFGCIEEKTF